jgi:hypothetical protein
MHPFRTAVEAGDIDGLGDGREAFCALTVI